MKAMKNPSKGLTLSVALLLIIDCINAFQLHHSFTTAPSTQSTIKSIHIGNRETQVRSSIPLPTSKFPLQYLNTLKAKTDEEDEDEDAWDSPEDYTEDKSKQQSFGNQPSLGIAIGSQLQPLTPEQAQSLKSEASDKINKAFDDRLAEIEKMKKDIRDDFERSKKNLAYTSELRAREETDKLMNKIDRLSNDFLMENEELRMGTKFSAKADRNMDGKGLEVGSWGRVGGMDVGMGMGLSDGSGSGVLGSIGSMTSGSQNGASMDNDDEEEMEDEVVDNRILVITDDKQEPNIQKVLDRFQTIISDEIATPITIEYYKPTANIPMGGNNAQCVIISSTSLSNGQSSANNILSRILRRTIAPMGGKISKPPSHFIVLSPLGTERIDKFPYSMTNMMGGNKLKKAREVEEVIISTVKGRLVADSGSGNGPSLDYTIVKYGDIVDDASILNKKDGIMKIAPGDSLDGKVGVEAAAKTLFQSTLLRPTARNATLSVIGATSSDSKDDQIVDEEQWEDWFLRLDGPELWRRDDLILSNSDEDEVERKFEQLAGFIDEWSDVFKNGAKGTGLTTPVEVVPSKFDNKIDTSIVRDRYGVRLEFKQTNTGNAYRSKDEEREMERQRSQPAQATYQKPGSAMSSGRKQSREGGVEIIVERVESSRKGYNNLRVRVKRCNMGDFTVVKELSEETIVKKIEKAVEIWAKQ